MRTNSRVAFGKQADIRKGERFLNDMDPIDRRTLAPSPFVEIKVSNGDV